MPVSSLSFLFYKRGFRQSTYLLSTSLPHPLLPYIYTPSSQIYNNYKHYIHTCISSKHRPTCLLQSSSSSSLLSFFKEPSVWEIVCENLPTEVCSFSIASSGKRCLLENYEEDGKTTGYQCTTSEVMVERMSEYIETDACVKACGVDRNSVGISSDTLLESQSVSKICSTPCYNNCPNIVDLYYNLAAAEGVFLPDLCEKQRSNPHRAMIELLSSGAAAGPATSENLAAAAPAPASI
ncbi:hypothetical protein HanRHA438_Chr15g0682951 [Helianthus annuus]|uniref:Putative PAR1 n=1 Tax=Helianthus annuus TaxID=4232 RepID=A0A251VK83_HELAN|nr:hypothetical protein HanXRQr2_Chr15g0671011 [Helianthus annuus]KAJ0471342.1 hypothetical protein HanHA89_Chr15g0595231 [Helianthus annuus]KAJ0646957.1 hypothetical protein HanLR1_Chr15g0556761 [Helianthus annuus]KAJ0842652.1 hypothetical protein HanRHA438_Chr15g0682951 [Helianthus annuus]